MNETLPNPDDGAGGKTEGAVPPGQGAPAVPPTRQAVEDPEFIGPYRIVGVLGSGGMGIVYKAEQREPIKRVVALKVIKAGMDTNEVIARFETERQALALMEHPCIARVLDAGTTSQGRPYFVMEFVGGERITDYCDRQNLSIPQRLELFAMVCEAVQHAHTKAIIHRDLKPSNILVQLVDNTPIPKIIDFGIAKATNQRLTEKTLFTDMGQLIGTPEYMSPEQAEMSAAGVDTRSDIYSLGVVLYELLIGALPFDPKTLRAAAYAEIQRIIREVDPPRMSTRLSSMGAAGTEIAKRRRAALAVLANEVRGELEWIPQKAMRKDRTERYEHASDLARDIRNYLSQQPLIAGPESVAYKLRKFVRRNRARVVGGAVAASIVLATAVAAFILVTQQRNEARRARDEAERARIAEVAAREQAERSYQAARRAVSAFSVNVSQSEMLKYESLRPLRSDFLQRAVDYYKGFLSESTDDVVRRTDYAQGLNLLGDALGSMGRSRESIEALRKAIEVRAALLAEAPNDDARKVDLAAATINLGNTFFRQAKYAEAIREYAAGEEILAPLTQNNREAASQLAQAHHNTAVAGDYLGDRTVAVQSFQKAIELRTQLHQLDPTSDRFKEELAQSLNALGKLVEADAPGEAIGFVRRANELRETLLQRRPDDTAAMFDLADSLTWLGSLQLRTNDQPAAAQSIARAVELWGALASRPEHYGQSQSAVPVYQFLTWSQLLAGQFSAAEISARRGLELSADDSILSVNLAHALLLQSKSAEAKANYDRFRGREIEGMPAVAYLKSDFEALRAAGHKGVDAAPALLDWLR